MNAQQSKQLKGTTGWTVRKFASTKYLQYNIAKDKYLANANLRKAISLSKTTGSTATRWEAMVAAERALLEDQGVRCTTPTKLPRLRPASRALSSTVPAHLTTSRKLTLSSLSSLESSKLS